MILTKHIDKKSELMLMRRTTASV